MPNAILIEILSQLLSIKDVCRLDLAMCNKIRRPLLLDCVTCESCVFPGHTDEELDSRAISWLYYRSLKVRQLRCDRLTNGLATKIGRFGRYLHWLSITDNDNCPRGNCPTSSFEPEYQPMRLATLVGECPNLHTLEIHCAFAFDTLIIKVADECPLLQSLNLLGCFSITDSCIVRLAETHPKLNSLGLGNCFKITDMSIIRIAEECPHLHTLSLAGCDNVTDKSVV